MYVCVISTIGWRYIDISTLENSPFIKRDKLFVDDLLCKLISTKGILKSKGELQGKYICQRGASEKLSDSWKVI